jgi:uncharacterized protein YceK
MAKSQASDTGAGTQPATTSRRRSLRLIRIALAMLTSAIAVSTLLGGCVTVVKGTASGPPAASRVTVLTPTPTRTSPTPSGPPPVAVADLPSLLLDTPAMRELLAAPKIEELSTVHHIVTTDEGSNYQPPECIPAAFTGTTNSYDGTDPIGGSGISFKERGDYSYHNVEEFVVAFRDASAAVAALTHVIDQWRPCRRISGTNANGQPFPNSTFGEISTNSGVTTLDRTIENTTWVCGRFLAAKSNIVVEGQVCSYNNGDAPQRLAQAILSNIP